MKKIFIAFSGPKIKQRKKFLIQNGFECWDLEKFSIDEFVNEIKLIISPINDNVLRNYKRDSDGGDSFGITEKEFKKCSWGLLLPDTAPDVLINSYSAILFLLNLYAPKFLYPVFYATDFGITKLHHKKNSLIYFHHQNQSKIFKSKKFVKFFHKLLPQSVYGTCQTNRFEKWDKEDWRLFVAVLLYSELKDYENEKETITWQREAADMMTILESLFTAADITFEEIGYRLRKRIATLIGFKFPNLEKDINTLYKERSKFLHGSFFVEVEKEAKKKDSFSGLPLPDFGFLYKHKEYVRLALLAYLNLALVVRQKSFKGFQRSIDVLEAAIIDLKLRKKVISLTKELFDLLPKNQFKS
jgi:hypothetical protein